MRKEVTAAGPRPLNPKGWNSADNLLETTIRKESKQ